MVDRIELKMCIDCHEMLPLSRFSVADGSPVAVCKRCWRARERFYRVRLQQEYMKELGVTVATLPVPPEVRGATRQVREGSRQGVRGPSRWLQQNEHILSLRFRDGMTLEDIARIEGVSRQAVCTKIWRFTSWVEGYFGYAPVVPSDATAPAVPHKRFVTLQQLEPLLRLRFRERLTYADIGQVVGRSVTGVMHAIQNFYGWLEREYVGGLGPCGSPVRVLRERCSSPSRWLQRVEPILRMRYREGMSAVEVGQVLGRSRAYVSEVSRQFNEYLLSLEAGARCPDELWLQAMQPFIHKRYVEELSYEDISRECSCT